MDLEQSSKDASGATLLSDSPDLDRQPRGLFLKTNVRATKAQVDQALSDCCAGVISVLVTDQDGKVRRRVLARKKSPAVDMMTMLVANGGDNKALAKRAITSCLVATQPILVFLFKGDQGPVASLIQVCR